MNARLLDAPALKGVLSEGRQAYLAVPSRRGPHATPALYGLANGLIGMWVATGTLKARVLGRHGGEGLHTGLLVRTPTAMAVVTGPVQIYDPIRRLAGPSRHLQAMGVTTSFLARNAADLAGFARDALRGRAGVPPSRRVLLTMAPAGAAVISADRIEVLGRLEDGDPPTGPFAAAAEPHVAVLEAASGLVPVPGEWRPDRGEMEVASNLVDVFGLRSGPSCVIEDDYAAPGPAAKRGRIVFGTAHHAQPAQPAQPATPDQGEHPDRKVFRFDVASESAWSGILTRTRDLNDGNS
ncbi:MAG TPA: hypothetical protein VFH58_13600 [Acidimicrobiales bacterium]|nr:hypothetical protein [Acidimicrobiales bacterium]